MTLILTVPTMATASTSTLASLGKAPTYKSKNEKEHFAKWCESFQVTRIDEDVGREGHLEGCPCRRILSEELGIDCVDRGEVLDVLEQHGGLHNMPVVAANSLEELPHVDQGLPRLLLHPGHQLPIRLHQQHHQHLSQC